MTKPSRANRNKTSTSLQPQLPYCSFRTPIPSRTSVSNTQGCRATRADESFRMQARHDLLCPCGTSDTVIEGLNSLIRVCEEFLTGESKRLLRYRVIAFVSVRAVVACVARDDQREARQLSEQIALLRGVAIEKNEDMSPALDRMAALVVPRGVARKERSGPFRPCAGQTLGESDLQASLTLGGPGRLCQSVAPYKAARNHRRSPPHRSDQCPTPSSSQPPGPRSAVR
jgi:hypothetical protein